MVAATDAEDDAAIGEPVGHGEVLGQAERVPHGGDVEAAAEAQTLGDVGEVDDEHQEVGDALVALGLEVVLGHPEGVVAVLVQGLGDGHALVEGGGEVLVGVGAVVDRGSAVADVFHVDVAGVQAVKGGNHQMPPVIGRETRQRRPTANGNRRVMAF